MKIYSLKRYKINRSLKTAIRDSGYSLRRLCKLAGFNVNNIVYYNLSINEEHFKRLESVLNKKFKLNEIKFDFTKNLGVSSHPINKTKKSKDLAEFIGIMLGDGCICMNNQIRIALDKRNIYYIVYVEQLFHKLFGVHLKKRIFQESNQAYLYFYSKKLVEDLIGHGLMNGDKIINNIGIPNWIKQNENYSKRCIKGLIDTDGCVFVCKREKQRYVNFTNCDIQLFNDFKEVVSNLGYSFAKSNNKNVRLYKKDEVVRFINEIKPFKTSPIR